MMRRKPWLKKINSINKSFYDHKTSITLYENTYFFLLVSIFFVGLKKKDIYFSKFVPNIYSLG